MLPMTSSLSSLTDQNQQTSGMSYQDQISRPMNSTMISSNEHNFSLSQLPRYPVKNQDLEDEIEQLKKSNGELKTELKRTILNMDFYYRVEQTKFETKLLREYYSSEVDLKKKFSSKCMKLIGEKDQQISDLQSQLERYKESIKLLMAEKNQCLEEQQRLEKENSFLRDENERKDQEINEARKAMSACACQNDKEIKDIVQLIRELRNDFINAEHRDANLVKSLNENNIDLNYKHASTDPFKEQLDMLNTLDRSDLIDKLKLSHNIILKQQAKIRELNVKEADLKKERNISDGLREALKDRDLKLKNQDEKLRELNEYVQLMDNSTEKYKRELDAIKSQLTNNQTNNLLDLFFKEFEANFRHLFELAQHFFRSYNNINNNNMNDANSDTSSLSMPKESFFKRSQRNNLIFDLIDKDFLSGKLEEMRKLNEKFIECRIMIGNLELHDICK